MTERVGMSLYLDVEHTKHKTKSLSITISGEVKALLGKEQADIVIGGGTVKVIPMAAGKYSWSSTANEMWSIGSSDPVLVKACGVPGFGTIYDLEWTMVDGILLIDLPTSEQRRNHPPRKRNVQPKLIDKPDFEFDDADMAKTEEIREAFKAPALQFDERTYRKEMHGFDSYYSNLRRSAKVRAIAKATGIDPTTVKRVADLWEDNK